MALIAPTESMPQDEGQEIPEDHPMNDEPEAMPAQEPVEFQLPEGVKLKSGESKTIMCTLEGRQDGKACLVKVQGVDLGGPPEKESPLKKYSDKKGSIESRFNDSFRPKAPQY